MDNINQILNTATNWNLFSADEGKEYWMVRTENRLLYNSFLEDNFVALSIPFVDTHFLSELRLLSLSEQDTIEYIKRYFEVNANSSTVYSEDRIKELSNPYTISLRASQLFNFVHKIRKGDIVLIPSHGANKICIGIIESDNLLEKGDFSLAKRVKWINTLFKSRLDPLLYKALGAHQALSNISQYREYIERNYRSYYRINDEYHFVLSVSSSKISAANVFGLGNELLGLVQSIIDDCSVSGINLSYDLNLAINLNSPGKIDLKTKNKKLYFLLLGVAFVLSGGSISIGPIELETNGLIKTIIDEVKEYIKVQTDDKKGQLMTPAVFINELNVNNVENTVIMDNNQIINVDNVISQSGDVTMSIEQGKQK